MPIETAIWFPHWSMQDQPIAVGQTEPFDFYLQPPPHIISQGLRVFYFLVSDKADATLFERRSLRIISIHHPVLGAIQQIDTGNLDYHLTMPDGRILAVEAEETPGLVYTHPEPIADWRIYVKLEPA